MKTQHGNSNENDAEHHLYEIVDQAFGEVYKYGICGDPINDDGSSPRANRQVKELNRAVRWFRFFAQILMKNIPGRLEAKRLEDQFIDDFEQKNGRRPVGND